MTNNTISVESGYYFKGWKDYEKFVGNKINNIVYSYLSRTHNFTVIQLIFRLALDTVAYYLNLPQQTLIEGERIGFDYIQQRLKLWNSLPGEGGKIDIDNTAKDTLLITFLYYNIVHEKHLDSFHLAFRKKLRYRYQNDLDDELLEVLNYVLEDASFEEYFSFANFAEKKETEDAASKLFCDMVRQNTYDYIVKEYSLENMAKEDLQRYYTHLHSVYSRFRDEYFRLEGLINKHSDEVSVLKAEIARLELKKNHENQKKAFDGQSKSGKTVANTSVRPISEILDKSFCSDLFASHDATMLLREIVQGKIKEECVGRAAKNNENWTWAHVRRAMVRCGFFGSQPEGKAQEWWEDNAISDTNFGHAIQSCDNSITFGSVKTQCTNNKDKHEVWDENIVIRICEYLKPIADMLKTE